jgi:MerR family copper efflux transcriptional regulator
MKHGRVESASLFIGKVARRPGVGVETTRFYERQGLLTPPVRKDPGYRLYPEQVFGRSRFLRRANELGFSLSEIKELLEVQTNSSARCEDVCEKAEAKIANIERKIDMLTKMKLCSPPEDQWLITRTVAGELRTSVRSQGYLITCNKIMRDALAPHDAEL